MSTQVAPVANFANPVTGEVLTLDSPDVDLGRYLSDLREFESVLREHKSMVNRELLARLDKRRSWTSHLPGMKLSAPSPKPDESWDGAELHARLLEFVDRDELDIEAVNAAVAIVTRYEPRKAGINALRKGGGPVADVVNELCVESERNRYISVVRS